MEFRGTGRGGKKDSRDLKSRERGLEEKERKLKERELEEKERRLKDREKRLKERELELEIKESEGKKGKVKVGEDYEFRAPEFDEKAFKFREMEEGKLFIILFAISIGMGLLAYALNPYNVYGLLGFIPILMSMSLVYLIPRFLNLDIDHYTKWKWAYAFLLYFLMCLGFWIVFTDAFSNPF